MTSIKFAPIGSISSGTLKTVDLLSAFISELEWQIGNNGEFLSAPENFALRDSLANLIGEAQDAFNEDGDEVKDEERASELVETLTDALGNFAKPYCYFGTAEGDGADFGFWPSLESIEELPSVEDREPGEDYKEVNDHGNVTVFSSEGKAILEIV